MWTSSTKGYKITERIKCNVFLYSATMIIAHSHRYREATRVCSPSVSTKMKTSYTHTEERGMKRQYFGGVFLQHDLSTPALHYSDKTN